MDRILRWKQFNKISVDGGTVVPLTDTGIPGGAAWGVDGRILFGGILNNGMRLLPPSGGEVAKLTDLGKGESRTGSRNSCPEASSPCSPSTNKPSTRIRPPLKPSLFPTANEKWSHTVEPIPHYLPSGHLVYLNKGTLFAIPFDPGKLETSGNATPILDDVKFSPFTTQADLSFSSNGTLVYRKGVGAVAVQLTLQWIDAAGKRSPLMTKAGVYANARLSPDAKRVAVSVTEGGQPGCVGLRRGAGCHDQTHIRQWNFP